MRDDMSNDNDSELKIAAWTASGAQIGLNLDLNDEISDSKHDINKTFS